MHQTAAAPASAAWVSAVRNRALPGAANLVERGHTAQMPALPRFQARHGEFGGRILVIHRGRTHRTAPVERGEMPGVGPVIFGVTAAFQRLSRAQHLVADRPHIGGGNWSHAPAGRRMVREETRPLPVRHRDPADHRASARVGMRGRRWSHAPPVGAPEPGQMAGAVVVLRPRMQHPLVVPDQQRAVGNQHTRAQLAEQVADTMRQPAAGLAER